MLGLPAKLIIAVERLNSSNPYFDQPPNSPERKKYTKGPITNAKTAARRHPIKALPVNPTIIAKNPTVIKKNTMPARSGAINTLNQ